MVIYNYWREINHQVTIINAHRPCNQSHESGISTSTIQQWDTLEELGQESTDIREKMIDDLTIFINKLIAENHEVILLIDANEPLPPGSGISRLLKNTNMIDPITLRHGFINIPNTHESDSQQIDYCFCTYLINNFIKLCVITSFNFFS